MTSEHDFGQFKFVRLPGSPGDDPDPMIEFTVAGDTDASSLIEVFTRFMHACGYSVSYEVELVKKENNRVSF